MKIAFVSESPADEAAIKLLVDAIVGSESELFSFRSRPNGWTRIFALLPNIIKHLHYGYEVEGLVVVMDSDDSPIHDNAHEMARAQNLDCRLCRLRETVQVELSRLRPLPNRTDLKMALGLAVPAIEAWYRAGLDPHVNEVAWNRKLLGEDVSYDRRSLKKDTYGSYQPSLGTETTAAVAAAQRLTENLELLEQLFPNGFGSLICDLRAWNEA
ncbi:MAG TPA: hypothetical protein VK582_08480 [Pyrinomonadaceae bacterium]|nr:hypothetical protein [Pyrinomonadaceae bacterium]